LRFGGFVAEQAPLPLEDFTETDPEPKEDLTAKELEELRAANATLQTQLEVERARLEERTKQPAPASEPAKAALSREQLQSAVDAGEISQSQMDAELERQTEERLEQRLTKKFEQEYAAKEQQRTIQEQFDSYARMRPDVKVAGTEDNRRVLEEIAALGKLGYPHDSRTEVLAMRHVFGPLDRVPETTRSRREVHRETGGAGASPSGGSGSAAWERGLSPGQVAAFHDQLDKGIYAGVDDKMFKSVVTRARTKNASRKVA
jgi:hypothetical protein